MLNQWSCMCFPLCLAPCYSPLGFCSLQIAPEPLVLDGFSHALLEITPRKFHIGPEKWWLEDDPFLLGPGNFSGAMLNFGRVSDSLHWIAQHSFQPPIHHQNHYLAAPHYLNSRMFRTPGTQQVRFFATFSNGRCGFPFYSIHGTGIFT